jgi:hypothetical protein
MRLFGSYPITSASFCIEHFQSSSTHTIFFVFAMATPLAARQLVERIIKEHEDLVEVSWQKLEAQLDHDLYQQVRRSHPTKDGLIGGPVIT